MVLFLRGQQWRIKWGKIFDGLVTMWEKMEAKFLKFKMFHIFWQWKASAALSFSLSLSRTTALSLSHTLPLYLSISHAHVPRSHSPIPFSLSQNCSLTQDHALHTHTQTHYLSLLLSSLPLSRSHWFLWILAVGSNLEDPTLLGIFWFFAAWSQNRRRHSFRLNLKRTKAMKNWFDLKTTRWNTYRSHF